ncbi:hypothetical protein D3C75_1312070 [compost metagenome]
MAAPGAGPLRAAVVPEAKTMESRVDLVAQASRVAALPGVKMVVPRVDLVAQETRAAALPAAMKSPVQGRRC